MSNRAWVEAYVSGALTGGFLILIMWLSYPAAIDSQSATEQACAEQQKQSALFRSLIGLDQEEASSSDDRTQGAADPSEQQTDYCDLAAQQSMAQSTLGMERATWLMAILTGVAVLFIYFTLRYTRQTLESADDTNKAAWETVRETQKATAAAEATTDAANQTNLIALSSLHKSDEVARRQLRAYVNVNDAKLDKKAPKNTIRALVTFKNSGQTPAYKVVVKKGIDVFPADIVDGDRLPEPLQTITMDPVVISPDDGVRASFTLPIDDETVAKIKSGKLVCVLYGICEYQDIFDINNPRSENVWWTEFRLRIRDFGGPNEMISPFGKSNRVG